MREEARRRKIGILGGTFDPIHYGHLFLAEQAREACGLDEVCFIPAGRPPHKQGEAVSPAEDRYQMTLLATLPHPAFTVSRLEIDRPGLSFAIETVVALREELGPGVELFFLIGADAMVEFPTWREPRRLLQLCRFIVVNRPGYSLAEVQTALGDLYQEFAERLHFLSLPSLEIAASTLRQWVSCGRSLRYLVPEEVRLYIQKRGLYRQGK